MSSAQWLWRPVPAVAILLVLTLWTGLLPSVAMAGEIRLSRIESATDTPIDAAIAISQRTFDSAESVMVARDDVFADSLASGGLQRQDSPLLLVPSNGLPFAVLVELRRLGASAVTILGNEVAVSSTVEQELRDEVDSVSRVGGETRIETAVRIGDVAYPGATQAVVARAYASDGGEPTQAFADSLGAGAMAADLGVPLLLTQTEVLTGTTRDWLRNSAVDRLWIVGGTAAVSSAVESELQSLGIEVTRLAGKERTTTALRVSEERGLSEPNHVVLLEGGFRGDAWSAGFAMAAFAAINDAAVLLTFTDQPSSLAGRVIRDHARQVTCAPLLSISSCEGTSGLSLDPVRVTETQFASQCLVAFRTGVTADFISAEPVLGESDQFDRPCRFSSTTIWRGASATDTFCKPASGDYGQVAYNERDDGASIAVLSNYDAGTEYCASFVAYSGPTADDPNEYEWVGAIQFETS